MYKISKFFYFVLAKISPFGAGVLAGWYSTISGWRFQDLKNFIRLNNKKVNNFNYLAKIKSLERIESDLERTAVIAFVSPIPPESTGIAACTFYSFYKAEECFDIFSSIPSDDIFLSISARLNSRNTRLIDVELLSYADTVLDYKAIIFAVGNSDHNFYLWNVFKSIEFLDLYHKCVLYVHDPFLNNFIQSGLGLSNEEYVELLSTSYKLNTEDIKHLKSFNEKWVLHSVLYNLGVTGVRVLAQKGFTRFLVNSKRARAILENDLKDLKVQFDELFHPVFAPVAFSRNKYNPTEIFDDLKDRDNILLIGSFGVPGSAKGTDVVIDAVRKIRARGVNAKLIVAGFGVDDYFKNNTFLDDDFLIKINSPSDAFLYSLISEVDVAVQLRLNDAGESSGVVPQLLKSKKKVIVSPIGAFKEYGELVSFLNNPESDLLSQLILNLMEHPVNAMDMEKYCQDRTPEAFRQLLIKYYT